MLFGLLLAGHLVGDFIVQTDRQALLKRWDVSCRKAGRERAWWRSIAANQGHCLTYHLTMAAFVLPAWHTWATLAAFAVSWATHGFIDRRWPVEELLRATGSRAWANTPAGVICADQALHIAILAVIAHLAGS